MIITISGRPGSGKSTVSKLVAKKMNLKHYSTGDFMRLMASNRKLSLLELSKLAETDSSIDEELDERQRSLALNEDDFVIDARLAFYFIPFSFKVFLQVSEEVAANRISGRETLTKQEALEKTRERLNSEHKRYLDLYNVNYEDKKHFNLVINTDDKLPDEIAQIIQDSAKSL